MSIRRKKIATSRALAIVRHYFPDVNTVQDAKEGLYVQVTNKDAQNSKRKAHDACAMAVACKRTLKLDGVIISIRTAYLVKGRIAVRFKVPEAVSREVVSFDRGGGFAPGLYGLGRPDHPLGHGNPHGGHRVGIRNPRPMLSLRALGRYLDRSK